MTARTWWRLGFGVFWVAAMIAVAVGTYNALGTRKALRARQAASAPHETTPIFKLPGTLYLAHKGGIYRMQDGVFAELQKPAGWTQMSIAPEGRRLVVVQRSGLNYSDIYLLDGASGQITNALTQNASSVVEFNHWSFYPRFSPDGANLFFSGDKRPNYTYGPPDLAIWEVPVGQPLSKAIKWTEPNDYTGGDVSPLPLRSGGILYVKYNVDARGESYSQLWLAKRPRDPGRALTQPEESCAQPALSADQSQVAMICAGDQRTTRLTVAPFDGSALGPRRTLVEGKLAAGPSWAPDGASLVFYAPGSASNATGNFQLWWLPVPAAAAAAPPAGSPTPAPAPSPRQVTDNLAFDALSPAAWLK